MAQTCTSMKNLITAILLLLSLNGLSQDWGDLTPMREKKVFLERISESVKVITICITSITLDAMGDAWIAQGKKTSMAHAFQATSTGILLMTPFVLDLDKRHWLPYGATYVSFRIALFDPIYNATRGFPMEHRSNSNLWDKTLTAINPPPGIMMFNRCLFLGLAISIPINEIR